MSMSVQQDQEDDDSVMSEINTTPLVDVMLVLLIVFLITIPVVNSTIKVNKPVANNIPTKTAPENLNLTIDAEGNVYRGLQKIPSFNDLLALVITEAKKVPQPEVHISADRETRYEAVGRTIYTVQRGGIVKVGFITEPARR